MLFTKAVATACLAKSRSEIVSGSTDLQGGRGKEDVKARKGKRLNVINSYLILISFFKGMPGFSTWKL